MSASRGQIVHAYVPGVDEPMYFLVVSNDRRNASRLGNVLGVRLTTTRKNPLPSIVVIPEGEGCNGRILCDEIEPIYDEDVIKVAGALSPATMALVNQALKAALALT